MEPPSTSDYSNKFDAKGKKWFEKEEPKIVLKQFHWRGVLNRGLTIGSAMTNFKDSNRDR